MAGGLPFVHGAPCGGNPQYRRLGRRRCAVRQPLGQRGPVRASRACLYTGMYMQNHRSVANGTPLDARFTNIALEAKRAGYDPVLFGYTDTSVDPRTVPAGDPRTFTYEGVLPGFRPIVNDPYGTRRHRVGEMAGRARHRRPVDTVGPLPAGHVVPRGGRARVHVGAGQVPGGAVGDGVYDGESHRVDFPARR